MSNIEFCDKENKTRHYIKQYAYGGISGMFGILLSHPLDTIKTHIQNGKSISSLSISLSNPNNLSRLYRGLSIPLIGVGFEKAIVFGTYNYMLKQTDSIALSGAISGLSASLIVSPYERLKILRQNSQTYMTKDIMNPRFLFKGLSATFTREVPGFAIYFSVYEKLKYHTFTKYGNNITGMASFIYGGCSGLVAWVFIYPQDKIKTIMQSSIQSTTMQSSIQSSMQKSYSHIIKNMYTSYGLTYFYKGFSWAAGRAMLLHSGTFYMMEVLNTMNYK